MEHKDKSIDYYYLNKYAEEYSKSLFKDKCDTDEYKNYELKLILAEDNFNKSVKPLEDKFNDSIHSYKNNFSIIEDNFYSKWKDYIPISELPDEYKPKSQSSTTTCDENGLCSVTYIPTPQYVKINTNCRNQKHCGIPDHLIYDYIMDYDKYSKSYQEYSDAYNKSYQEYSDAYNKSYQEYLISYSETTKGIMSYFKKIN